MSHLDEIGEYNAAMKIFVVLFCTLMIGLVLYQLATGKLLDRGWTVWTTRQERPLLYWTLVALQAALVAGLVYMALIITERVDWAVSVCEVPFSKCAFPDSPVPDRSFIRRDRDSTHADCVPLTASRIRTRFGSTKRGTAFPLAGAGYTPYSALSLFQRVVRQTFLFFRSNYSHIPISPFLRTWGCSGPRYESP